MKSLLTVLLSLFFLMVCAQHPEHYYVEIKTSQGNLIVQLLNETPLHRDNFKKLVEDKYYDDLLFHRVINNFMIQTGDPDSRYATINSKLGSGGPEYRIPAEIQKNIFHVKGALGAARDNNPEKASSGSQFYIVQGKKFTSAGLDSLEVYRMNGVKFSDAQREAYMNIGGTPHLDGNYTVFGRTISGVEAVDKIAAVDTDDKDRPFYNERLQIRLLNKLEATNIEREQKGLKLKKKVSGGLGTYKLKK